MYISVFDYTTQRFPAPVRTRSSENRGALITKLDIFSFFFYLFFFFFFFQLLYATPKINDKTDFTILSVHIFTFILSFSDAPKGCRILFYSVWIYDLCVCVCVYVRARARVRVYACVRACACVFLYIYECTYQQNMYIFPYPFFAPLATTHPTIRFCTFSM